MVQLPMQLCEAVLPMGHSASAVLENWHLVLSHVVHRQQAWLSWDLHCTCMCAVLLAHGSVRLTCVG
jgi:hypothetical protein